MHKHYADELMRLESTRQSQPECSAEEISALKNQSADLAGTPYLVDTPKTGCDLILSWGS